MFPVAMPSVGSHEKGLIYAVSIDDTPLSLYFRLNLIYSLRLYSLLSLNFQRRTKIAEQVVVCSSLLSVLVSVSDG